MIFKKNDHTIHYLEQFRKIIEPELLVNTRFKDYYDDLGNPADAADFKTYLIANLRLYFDSWENALQNDADPQFSQDVNKAVEDAQADIEAGEVSDAATAEEPATEEGGDDMTDLELDLDI